MIKAPNTYAEWASVLDMLKNKSDDDEVYEAMQNGSINWQSGVAERFSQKLVNSINFRINMATDKFQKSMSRSGGQERLIVQALLAVRKELSFLVKVIEVPAMPEKQRMQYKQLVIDEADNIQKSLEDSAKTDRSGKLSSIVRNHRVNNF